MKYCNDYAALLDLYIDGELSPADMIRVQTHLDTCPACQAYVDDALAIRAAFPGTEDTEVPDDFAEHIMAAIQAGDPIQAAPPSPKKKKTPWAGVLVSLAACCAIVILQQNTPLFQGKAETASTMDSGTAPAETAIESCSEAPAETGDEAPASPAEGIGRSIEDTVAESEEAPAELAEAKTDAAAPFAQAENTHHRAILYLPPEHADLLHGHTPILETDTELQYELSPEAYDVLLAQLEAAQIVYMSEDGMMPSTDTSLIIIEK